MSGQVGLELVEGERKIKAKLTVWSAYDGATLFVGQYLSTKAEIGYFNGAVHAEQYVVRFDVSMNDSERKR